MPPVELGDEFLPTLRCVNPKLALHHLGCSLAPPLDPEGFPPLGNAGSKEKLRCGLKILQWMVLGTSSARIPSFPGEAKSWTTYTWTW